MNPRIKTKEKIPFILEGLTKGLTLQQIGNEIGVTKAAVSQLCKNHGINPKIGQIIRREQRDSLKEDIKRSADIQRERVANKFRLLCNPNKL